MDSIPNVSSYMHYHKPKLKHIFKQINDSWVDTLVQEQKALKNSTFVSSLLFSSSNIFNNAFPTRLFFPQTTATLRNIEYGYFSLMSHVFCNM